MQPNNAPLFNYAVAHAARYIAGGWFATQIFFLFGTTLPIFQHFDREHAGQIVRVLFPVYYAANFVYATLFAAALLVARKSLAKWKCSLSLAILAAACVAVLQFGIAPTLAAFRESAQVAEFDRLHGFSMVINSVNMLCVLLAGIVFRAQRKTE